MTGIVAPTILTLASCLVALEGGVDSAQEPTLPFVDIFGPDYRTPRAGQGFEFEVMGSRQTVPARDRRWVLAASAGFVAVPKLDADPVLPFGSVYLWYHPSDEEFLRAVLVGFYDEVTYARSIGPPFEAVVTFENFTIPIPDAELLDGGPVTREELFSGHVRAGLGVGYRSSVGVENDNMTEVSISAEQALLYFAPSEKTDPSFVVPPNTHELRAHLRFRLDALERNVVDLPHAGFAVGADAWIATRNGWRDWGVSGRQRAEDGASPAAVSAYAAVASGLPFVGSDHHRVLLSVHAGRGLGLDRFSRFRLGGGPSGREYDSLPRPLLPGAAINELATDRYAIVLGEYRYEPIFFSYLSARASWAIVGDRPLASLGARVETGFLFETFLDLCYDYNSDVVRGGARGGHQISFNLSRGF